ncbi:flagellin lysine-N-methylase [Dysosmobacter sp.]|uniref:flagellin lysine-N-methylase n=1 Tax=Dysosmobacter sp. TaxID=2591382 RepID=UPI002A961026|nr:flagellin lysine-N-methylase [Dysosmobacter sp.]MDY5612035.1 flagellin lysine-N-methylase [Dysosmobacter sp.]
MLVRVPDYFDQFQCLAGACPHTCCEKWEVVIDEETAAFYQTVPGDLGDKLRSALQVDEDGDVCFPLDGGRCPFLDGDNLCEIHRKLGEDATSVTCREHPRFTEDYGSFREITLSASCPAANALLLGSGEPLAFRSFETEEPKEDGDEWLEYLISLRERMLDILADRSRPVKARLASFLALALSAQHCLDDDCPESLPETGEAALHPAEDGLFPGALSFLTSLEILESDWPALLKQAETVEPGTVPEALLERIAAYFAFRYLLKAVNDGDLLGRAELCVFAVLTVERLAGVCGLTEALRRFSCEIEHDDSNLDALLEAFAEDEALSPERFLAELGR